MPATLAWSQKAVARFVPPVSWPPSVPLPGSVQAGPRFAAAPGRRSHSGSQARNSANVCGYGIKLTRARAQANLSAWIGPASLGHGLC